MAERNGSDGGRNSSKKKSTNSKKPAKKLEQPKIGPKLTPSAYLKEMNVTTQERMASKEIIPPRIIELTDIGTFGTQKDFTVSIDVPLFQPTPSEVVFQQLQLHKTQEFQISLRNLDRVARYIKVTDDQSPYFVITSATPSGRKVAPGMEAIFTVRFTPDEDKDYHHELIFITEREKFVIPVKAIGSRGLLDFPDDVHFNSVPVKYNSTKTVLVRNIGKKETSFKLVTTKPFSVTPSHCNLSVNECIQVNIDFQPMKTGDYNGELLIHYDTKETVYVSLYGTGNDVNVRLDKNSLIMESTYIGLTSQRIVMLHNRSNIVAHFEWKMQSDPVEEELQRELLSTSLKDKELTSKNALLDQSLHNPFLRDRLPLLNHTYDIKESMIQNEKFLYYSDIFSIDPMEGDVWPQSSTEVTITFQPDKAHSYSSVAYCDVAGRETRLPLKLKGEGLGPKLRFSFDQLDIQNVFVNSAHAYEIVLENQGDIPTSYGLLSHSGLFGPMFSFAPSTGQLEPDSLQAIQISFSSSMLGHFDEKFTWEIEGSPTPLTLRIMGTVIGPTFQFSESRINFGTISYGFPVSHDVIFKNTSEVSMTYRLHIPTDDDNEFTIQPNEGELPPSVQKIIKVTITPTSVKTYNTVLMVDIAEAGNELYSLPLQANSIVPKVVLETTSLHYGRCFIYHPYTIDIQLQNTSILPVKYRMTEQNEKKLIEYSTTHPHGVINGHQCLTLPLTIRPTSVGQLTSTASIEILGSSDPPLYIQLHCIGEGPVISIHPDILDWAYCNVLTPTDKRLIINNESEIDAEFQAYLMKENTVFSVQPMFGIVPRREMVELIVTAQVDDNARFTDKLTVSVKRGVSHTIPLLAEGKGTTIVSHPSFDSCVDLGTHFACSQCRKQFTLTNRGRRMQALSWTTEGFSMVKLKKAELDMNMVDKSDVNAKSAVKGSGDVKRPMYQLIPDKFELLPLQSQTFVITAYSAVPQEVKERLVCHSIIGRNPHKERIMSFDVKCRFISPLLDFSTKEVTFDMEQEPGSELIKHYKTLQLKNITPLPLTALLTCNYPFSLSVSDINSYNVTQEISLSVDESVSLSVQYDSRYCTNRKICHEKQAIEISYKEHPQKDSISLMANVFFPNLEFSSSRIDFGSILNNTEMSQTITVTNNSPLPVRYAWSFIKRPPVRRDPLHDDEGVDMESEIETDSLDGSESLVVIREEHDEAAGGRDFDSININIIAPTNELEEKEEESSRGDSYEREEEEEEEEENMITHQSLPPSVPSTASTRSIDLQHQPWKDTVDPFQPISIDQIFDILPLFGTLEPGESQNVLATFFGHTDISTEVIAACKVEGGPAYEVVLAGEASDIQYKIDKKRIDIGCVLYDHVCCENVQLTNVGKVSLDYTVCDAVSGNDNMKCGDVTVSPSQGLIKSLEFQTLCVRFFPGAPGYFKKKIKIQVSHFESETIVIMGEAVYPQLSLNVEYDLSQSEGDMYTRAVERLKNKRISSYTRDDIVKEMETSLIEDHIQDHNIHWNITTKSIKIRPTFPYHHLDFGCVVYGLLTSRSLTLTNKSKVPLNLTALLSSLNGTGFSIDLPKRIKALPVGDFIDFNVFCDPASVNLPLGVTEVVLNLQLVGGPIYPLKLTANVVLPYMVMSSQSLDFGTIQCGHCSVHTIRLHNPLEVKCEWSANTDKEPKKLPKHTPLHIRRKIKDKPPPKYFEVEPSRGILLPHQKMDIQVKFMPSEDHLYIDKIPFIINLNPNADLNLSVEGQGTEPHVIFDKSLIEFSPILPFSSGSEVEVKLSNPLDYQLEIYSLEFDKQYVEEEKILRWVKGYDKKNRLYLPPVKPGETLPHEIVEAFKKEDKPSTVDLSNEIIEIQQDDSSLSFIDKISSSTKGPPDMLHPPDYKSPSSVALIPQDTSMTMLSNATLGSMMSELQDGIEPSPVLASIARYLGIDISPKAAVAEARRGIALVVYGPIYSGKSIQCHEISRLYDISMLTMNDIIIDAISSASTPAGCKARVECMEATKEILEAITEAVPLPPNIETTPLASKASISAGQPLRRGSRLMSATKDCNIRKESSKTFTVLPLYDTDYAVPDSLLFATKLSEELVTEIISDRLILSDCRKGVIIDGLECIFTGDHLMSAALLLKGLNNRKHIYFVNLELDLSTVRKRVAEIEQEKQLLIEEKMKAQKEEEERIQSLLDMNEDEYEALPIHKQREIDEIRQKRYLEKKKIKMQKEQEEKERKEKERQEELKLEEERTKGKKGRGGKGGATTAHGDHQAKSSPSHGSSRPESGLHQQLGGLMGMSTVSIASSVAESAAGGKKKRSQLIHKEANKEEMYTDNEEDSLKKDFQSYDNSRGGVRSLLEDWDRTKGLVKPKKLLQAQPEIEEKPSKVSSTPKKKNKKTSINRADVSPQKETQPLPMSMDMEDLDDNREGVGVPMIHVAANKTKETVLELILKKLPTPEEILLELGLGPDGPPIPEPATFQVYHYPLKRHPIQENLLEHFLFIQTVEPIDSEKMLHREISQATIESSEAQKEETIKKSDTRSREDLTRKRSVKSRQQSKTTSPSPQHQQQQQQQEEYEPSSESQEVISNKLVKHRWIVPANGECKMRLLFTSKYEGQFDQTLNFEIQGTRRRYQLFCRGLCQLPTISKEPRIVFPNRKRAVKKGEIISKKYLLDQDEFHFGPLHCGKPRERYREGRYPENMESFTISNCGSIESVMTICFKNDVNASTFLLEPPEMVLQPGENQTLTVWAYPKTPVEFRDQIVCSIQHNPDPVIFKICCIGVEPELKVDKKLLEFGKVLLHRRESRVLHLRNNTLLPAAWKLSGTEMLGDEFSFSQEQGIVQPKSEFPLNIHFRAAKPVSYNKRAFKIEISDVEQIIGLMHVENIQLQAEGYDVALDISFPKGTDGGLDFGSLRVFEDLKLVMQVKNRGKYEMGYNFAFDPNPGGINYSKLFVITPVSSLLIPGEKSQGVSISFKPDRELVIKDQPLLKCQVIDTQLGEHGEVIANIPIRITAKSAYSKYFITPVNDVNFGSVVINSRKSTTLTIENKGEFEFRYAITKKLPLEVQKMRQAQLMPPAASHIKRNPNAKGEQLTSASRSSSIISKVNNTKNKEPTQSLRYEVLSGGSQRLAIGLFTITPATGLIAAGQSLNVTIDCIAERQGKHEEYLSIEISDGSRNDMPLNYKILAEVLVPAIDTADIVSIFEEHRICKQLSILGMHEFDEEGCVGVYGENEKRFVFKSVIVGSSSKARFKITNPNKVPCDVNMAVKSTVGSTKQKGLIEVFEVTPARTSLLPHSHVYANVTFRPTAMQIYNAVFEALVEGPSQAKGKGVTIDLQGEGNLPQIAIIKPTTRNTKGENLLLFKKLLLGQRQCLPIILHNTGSIPAVVTIQMEDERQSDFILSLPIDKTDDIDSAPVSLSSITLTILPGIIKELTVTFQPQEIKEYTSSLWLHIRDNQFETVPIIMVGEGYQSDVIIDNIRRHDFQFVECSHVVDDIGAMKESNLNFGLCPVGESIRLSFTLTNMSQTDPIRFQWPTIPCLVFSPSVGHILPAASRDITVTFTYVKPKEYKQQRFAGKYWKISYNKPLSQVSTWDESMKKIKWINVPPVESRPSSSSSSGGKKQDAPSQDDVVIKYPLKNKVIETEPEPDHKLVDKNGEDLEVFLTAETTFAEYECPSRVIKFKDTYVLQTKAFKFPLKNTGRITLVYKWYMVKVPSKDEEPPTSAMEEKMEESLVSIHPSNGEIPPGEEQMISVKFTPSDVVNISYKFCCKMSHLKGSAKPLYILVQCSSIVPYCHFELPETDYISRRPFDTKGTYSNKVDQTTKVIEFTSIGTGNKIMRSFHIVNPTDLNYEFVWTPLEEGPLHVSPLFKCLTPKGQISGGKKYEVKFEYKPTNEEWVESHWNFTIPSLSLTVPFLLVGHMQDPNITFDRSYLNFKSLLIGSRSTETVYLINNEDKPYSFTIDENSCCSYNYKAKLIVFPLSGTIPPNDKFPVEISFTAVEEREFIFHLVCNLKKKVIPLTLNVKALGYAINMTLSYTDASDKEYPLSVDKNSKRIIDFGKVPINDRGLWKVAVHNSSQFGLHCRWILSDKCLKKGGAMDQLITISPTEELISAHHKGTIQLTYSPTNSQPLKNCLLTLQITNGPELPIALKGTGVEPHVVFSFMGYSFGPRFLHHPNMPPNITTLTITNKEDTNVTIECLYTSTTNIELLLDSSLVVLSPDETMDIDCYFRPYEAIKYSKDVIFEINGLCKKCINISGEGAVVKVEPSMKSVNLGSLLVREKSSKIVKLTNMSPLAVTFTVNILPSALVPALQEEGVLSVWFCLSKAQQAANVKEVTLRPKEVISVEVSFCPTVRVPHFSEEVIMESHGLSYPLFIVKGSCHGLDVSLDNNHIPFGAVVLCSKSVRRIQMVNNGDIGTRFEWKVDKFGPDFSISPAKGYLSTGMQIPFDVTFHPVKVHNDIRYDNLLCHIEKGQPLSLTLTGVCIEQTASKEVLHFATTVRNKETKQLTINNKTSTPWLLHPIIDGEYWSGPISLSVGSSQVGHYELTYTPLLMTQDTQKHQGSIFFPLPDGTGLLYNLLGTADAPKHSGSIVQEIPCKTSHVELLSVQNWLPQSQRFRAIIEMIRPEKLDRSVNMYGVEYIDVPARSKRDYKIHFYSYKEGSFLSKVTFLNEQSGEYQFFHVHFKSIPAGIIGTIELATSVRHSVSHTITLDNPFPTPINVNTSVNISDISIPTSFLIGAESQGKCTFEYLPLKVDELTGKMTLQCSELGTYQYELHLKATPPASEKPVHFTASLGSSQTLPCYFTSYAKGRTEYSCKIDSSDFHVDKSITVSTNEASIDVNFEPSCLGDTHAALMISSVTGGDYIIPLTGHCLVPKPQGPYTIKAGASITIPYRNAFHQTQTFSFFIDNPAFSCKASDNLKPRKLYNILVHFDAKQADPSLVKLGKLIVSCKGSAKTGGTLKWTYYLKGLALDK